MKKYTLLINTTARACVVLALVIGIQACVTTSTGKIPTATKEESVTAYVKLGMTYLQKNDRENALRAFNSALKKDKKSAEAHQGMALIHQKNGEVELAEKSFKKALKGRADFSESGVRVSYGRFLFSLERYEEAVPYFKQPSEDISYVSRANAFYYLGLTYQKLNDVLRARVAFDRALNLKTNHTGAAIELAQMAFDEKDFSKSQEYLSQFLKSNRRPTARSLWLSIQIERIFDNKDKEASSALALKNFYPYSKEYLMYKESLKKASLTN